MSATTVGWVGGVALRSIVVRSKTNTDALPFATNSVLPSSLTSSPSGPDIGLTPFPLEAQHCAPGNPPNFPFAPKPLTRWKGGVRHPKRVKLPKTVTMGGMLGSQL